MVRYGRDNLCNFNRNKNLMKNTMSKEKSLKNKIWRRVKRFKEPVIFTRDFSDLSGSAQICCVLKTLCNERLLIRLGKGVYPRLFYSYQTKPIALYKPENLPQFGSGILCIESSTKIYIEYWTSQQTKGVITAVKINSKV